MVTKITTLGEKSWFSRISALTRSFLANSVLGTYGGDRGQHFAAAQRVPVIKAKLG